MALHAESRWDSGFFEELSRDLKDEIPNAKGFSSRNLRYMKRFYELFPAKGDNAQQIAVRNGCQGDDEKELKDALVANISQFLMELGTGFALLGREYRLKVGETEQWLDLLFYHAKLHCYAVIEVKASGFKPEYVNQLGTYDVAIDHHGRVGCTTNAFHCALGAGRTVLPTPCDTFDSAPLPLSRRARGPRGLPRFGSPCPC